MRSFSSSSMGNSFLKSCRSMVFIGLAFNSAFAASPASIAMKSPATPGGSPPNVVVFLVDDLRYDVLSHEGYEAETPSIDRLAREGVRFSRAYVVNSLCSPSRASLLTGKYAHANGVFNNSDSLLIPTIAETLQATHTTAMIGKWHLGREVAEYAPQPGWDRWFAMPGQGRYNDPTFNVDGEWVTLPGYNTTIIKDEAVRFIRETPGPFFLHLAFKGVHEPYSAAAEDIGTLMDTEWPRRPNAATTEPNLRRDYQETLMSVDRAIGSVLDELDQRGLAGNTIVVFTSDNGLLLREHARHDKGTFFEESIRVPLIFRIPGVPGAQVREQIALNIDIMPTLLDMLNYDIPDDLHGQSLLPVVKNPTARTREEWLYTYFRGVEFPELNTMLALVGKQHKYVEFPDGGDMFCYFSGKPMLFDVIKDPFEMRNAGRTATSRGTRNSGVAQDLSASHERLTQEVERLGLSWPKLSSEEARTRIEWLTANDPRFMRFMPIYYPDGFESFEDLACAENYWP